MKRISINGVKVPKLGFGTWCVGDEPKSKENELSTLNVGYEKYGLSLIDTAEMYGEGKSEKVVGEFLKGKKVIYVN